MLRLFRLSKWRGSLIFECIDISKEISHSYTTRWHKVTLCSGKVLEMGELLNILKADNW